MNKVGILQVKAVALAVADAERAKHFYGQVLGLPPDTSHPLEMAYRLGDAILMLKPQEDWYAKPTEELNPRITVQTEDAYATERVLREGGVTISDPVVVYGGNLGGSFLDSEGNKIWFCSEAH